MREEAIVAVIVREGRILIIQRAPLVPAAGYWTPVSGRLEPGERQADAVVRETLEEVGIRVRPIQRVWQCPSSDGRYRLHWWLAEFVDGNIVLAPDEVSEARWMTVQAFLALEKTFVDDRYFFQHVFPQCQ